MFYKIILDILHNYMSRKVLSNNRWNMTYTNDGFLKGTE